MIISSTTHVRSVSGSDKRWPKPACSCESWIKLWDINCLYPLQEKCPACGVEPDYENPWVGGHVQRVRKNELGEYVLTNDQTVYIVPICDRCNKSGNIVFSVDSDYLVPMAASECRADL